CGPSHAPEVAKGLPASIVAAGDSKAAKTVQALFNGTSVRVYTSPDMLGVEMGAALKNVIALGAGLSDGLGLGYNAKAALLTREEQIARIDRQLTELYQPLVALLEESRLSRLDFLKKEGRSQVIPTDREITREELDRWIDKIEKDLMPRNLKMCELIRSKREL